ncbi:MAG: hypothetical protein M3Y56_14720 [Armatimonadota bacterium]|nr:hypothetical protein [Armatimonadota bacterium]
MAKTLIQDANVGTDEAADLKRAVRDCISELECVNERMAARQVRINKLKIETRAILDELKVASKGCVDLSPTSLLH